MHARLTTLWLVVLLGLTAGCRPWRVLLESGPPSALQGAQYVDVVFDYRSALLGGRSEQAWLASQPPHDVAAYHEVKRELEEAFLQSLSSHVAVPVQRAPPGVAAPGGVLLVVRVTKIEQGKYVVVYAMDSELDAILEWQRSGRATDAISIQTRVEASMTRPAIIQRMRVAADRLGELTARFFNDKQG